jgi:hypothetical protein
MSFSRSIQSRINGAKSRGPRTPQGKARSSLNALKHGHYATNAIVLSNEDPQAFEELVTAFVDVIHPLNPVEYRLTRELAGIDWRLTRLVAVDSRILDHELDLQLSSLAASGVAVADLTRVALAMQGVIERSRLPDFLGKRQTQLIRDRQSTLRTLQFLRKRMPQAEPAVEIIPPRPLDPEAPFSPEDTAPETPPAATSLDTEPQPPEDAARQLSTEEIEIVSTRGERPVAICPAPSPSIIEPRPIRASAKRPLARPLPPAASPPAPVTEPTAEATGTPNPAPTDDAPPASSRPCPAETLDSAPPSGLPVARNQPETNPGFGTKTRSPAPPNLAAPPGRPHVLPKLGLRPRRRQRP